jgi:hypothetical protein
MDTQPIQSKNRVHHPACFMAISSCDDVPVANAVIATAGSASDVRVVAGGGGGGGGMFCVASLG